MVDIHNLNPHFAPSSRLSSVRFMTYSSKDIKRISCKKITNPNTFDSLLHPNLGGLYDPALGPCDKLDLCGTCGLNYIHCPGHMGHIPLPLPVYHPIFFMTMYQLLRGSCWNCHRLLCTPYKAHLLIGQLELIKCGLLSDALELENAVSPDSPDAADKFQDHADSVIQVISQFVQTRKIVTSSDSKTSSQVATKNLVELKNVLVNDLFKHCSSNVKKCSYCSAPIRRVRQENHTRVFLKGLSKKNAGMWLTAHKVEQQRKMAVTNTRQSKEGSGEESENEEAAKESASPSSAMNGIELAESEMTIEECSKQRYVTPTEVREHIRGLWENQRDLMEAVFCSMKVTTSSGGDGLGGDSTDKDGEEEINPADMFFLGVVPVPPSRFRPISQLGDKRFENPQTSNLHYILVDCIGIHELMEERRSHEELGLEEEKTAKRGRRQQSFSERLQAAWVKLQHDVNCFMDSSCDKKGSAPNGIKQILEKKEGLFRKHMMGKRVDYAARSVISPDPYINMDEIGIPKVFATRLTYPQPVTHWNVKDLRQAVINGPKVHPGATHVQNEDGSIVLLSASNKRQRCAIAKKLLTPSKEGTHGGACKKVFRHLNDGDILLLNRQPTLHKPSIMAHKARVLSGEKTLRLHYANCKSYNADFDGDEMNAHFPQNELARAEAYSIVSTHHQYLVPKDGTPLSGLIQDHVVSGVLMTIRGRMFNRSDYMQLVFSALPRFSGHFKTLPPCIWKPATLWSGKQVVSTLLLNIIPEDQDKLNLLSKAKIADKEWGRSALKGAKGRKKKKKKKRAKYSDDIMTESEVVFRQGELLCGVLDKSQFGASQYGFVHSCFELYGGAVADLLLSALGRLFTTFLQLHGFSLGVEDILVTSEADQQRHDIIAEGRGSGPDGAAEAFGLTEPTNTDVLKEKYEAAHRSRDGSGIKTLDYFMKKKTDHYNNLINSACVPVGLHKPFPANCLQLMVQAGAKGSTVNCMQISCLLGQIELEGQRPPLMASGRFLPSFLPYDTSPRAGGFVDGRFLTGIRPQEYFFHCMAGREGLVDTAVKTSRSGYLQRCLIKHLEGICVAYDLTVRDSDGSVVQFLYGEDGVDIGKTSFLKEKQFPFLCNNYQALVYNLNPKAAVNVLESKKVHKYQKKVSHWSKKHGSPDMVQSRPRKTGFLDFSKKHLPEIKARFVEEERSPSANYRTKAELEVIDLWYGMSPMARTSLLKRFSHAPSPIVAHLPPDRHFGSVPDKLIQQVDRFIERNPLNVLSSEEQSPTRLAPEKFHNLVQFKYLRSLNDPGEAVGLLAAQSVGEPSTQMTLNTFHFAGRGEMNVTLGIPRLREILMTASPNIKTPAMDVPLLKVEGAREKGEKLKKMFTRVCISEVLEKVEVWESLAREGKGHQHRLFKVKMSFLPQHYYSEDFVVSPSGILGYVERIFIKKLVAAVKKEMNLIKEKRTKSVSVENDLQSEGKSSSHDNSKDGDEKETSESTQEPKDDDDDDLSDMEGGDADASSAKQLARKKEHASYEDPGESDEEVVEGQTDSEGELSDVDNESVQRRRKQQLDEDHDEDGDDGLDTPMSGSPSPMDTSQMDSDRVQEVLARNSAIVEYYYDSQEEEWCQFTLKFPLQDSKVMLTSVIEKLAPKAVVWETPQIKKGFLSESNEPGEDGVWRLKTDGVNLQVLWHHTDILDLTQVYTNNIHAMANTYGIEAAYKAIIKEISGVFKVYGITVDYHHLSLIADYMTFEGTYKPFNRIGMETNSSPFQKMSFETTMHFLKSATIAGDTDPIRSPSACLVAGRVVKGGTGSFELLQRLV